MKTAPKVVRAVYQILFVLLFAWPIASFAAIFLFDAPMRGSLDSGVRHLAAYSIWFYPVLFFWARYRAVQAVKAKSSVRCMLAPFALPASPVLLTIAFILFSPSP